MCPEVPVCTEPQLQPLNGEEPSKATAIRDDCARLDVGFGSTKKAIFDARVLTFFAVSNSQTNQPITKKHEEKKRRVCSQRV